MLKKLTLAVLALFMTVNISTARTPTTKNIKPKGKQSMPSETAQAGNPLTKEQEKQIDALFSKFDHNNTPGCAVGIIQNGRFIYQKSFGMADLEHAVPITADSRFELGSTSKQFTAACIALLQSEGKINLDDDLRKYIPELPDYGNVITIRHLLHHTSGLRDHVALYFGLTCGMTNDNYLSMEDAVKLVCRQKQLNFKPGEKHSYSNSGYLLLAEIISRVSKKKYSEYVKENIFLPLNMMNSSIDEDCRQVVQNRVPGYIEAGEAIYSKADHNSNDIGAKGVLTTINDLLLWDDNFYSGKVGGKGLTELMQTQGHLNNNEKIDYGYGLFFSNYKNMRVIGHPGGCYGFSAAYNRYPDQKVSLIILSNAAFNGTVYMATDQIADIVLKDKLKEDEAPASGMPSVPNNEPLPVKLTTPELEKFCGHYWSDAGNLNRKIYLKDGSLFYWRAEQSESKLIPVGKNELFMEGQPIEVKLVFDLQNQPKTVSILQNGTCTSVLKSYEPVVYTLKDLNQFAGNYYSQELDVIYKVTVESDKLVLFLRDRRIAELKVLIQNIFNIVEWDTNLKFYLNKKKAITGFKLEQGEIKDIDFVKQQ